MEFLVQRSVSPKSLDWNKGKYSEWRSHMESFGNIEVQRYIILTCKCQKRKVKMSPIPTPMIQATIMNVSKRKLEKA